MKKNIITTLLALSGITIAAGAQAQQAYVGGTVGESFWNVNCDGTTSCSTHDNGYKAIVGYAFDKNWAVEGTYFSAGQINASVDSISGSIKASGVDLAAVFKSNLTKEWSVFAKLGVTDNKAVVSASEDDALVGSYTTKKAELLAGFGVLYAVTPNFAIRADIDTRKVEVDVPNYSMSSNVTALNIGFQVAF